MDGRAAVLASSSVIALLTLAVAAEPPNVDFVAPLREDQHPRYFDAENHFVRWSQIRPIARQTDVMSRVRKRQLGRGTLRVLFTTAAVAETWGTVALVNRDSDWAWALGAQTGLTALAAGLLWSEIPRSRRMDRAEMLDASNTWLRTQPSD